MKEVNYNKLRLDILEKLISEREIECKDNKTDMIRHLILYDEGKYIKESTVEKYDKDKFLIGIDSARHNLMIQMGKLIEKNEAVRYYYANGRHYFITKINILENGLE
jgi:hypothetical protein